MTMSDTDRLAALAALLDNRQMPDDATPKVTLGDLRALRAYLAATPAPLGECGYDEPHEPHTYVLAENDRPVDHECPGLDATPAPLMDIQKQSVVTTAPLDVPGHVHPGHILCAACVNNGMSAASAAERPATPNGPHLFTPPEDGWIVPHSYEKWIRPKVVATPAPLDVHQTPGEYHDYRVACVKCGEPGFLHVSWRPEKAEEKQ